MAVEKQESNYSWLVWTLLLLPGGLAVASWCFYATKFGWPPGDPGNLGAFGDFFGGLLNPVVSTLTLAVAIGVWRLQKKELSATKKILDVQANTAEQQRAEQRFFDLVGLYLKTLDSFSHFTKHPTRGQWHTYGRRALTEFLNSNECPSDAYGWRTQFSSGFLSNYFRITYLVLRTTESLFTQKADQQLYVELFREQLSKEELQLIALHIWYSEEGKSVLPLAEKYHLLMHLPVASRTIALTQNGIHCSWPERSCAG